MSSSLQWFWCLFMRLCLPLNSWGILHCPFFQLYWNALYETLESLLWINLFLYFSSLQPVRDTREKQVQLWKELIIDYCRAQKVFLIGLEEDFPLFSNSVIESKFLSYGMLEISSIGWMSILWGDFLAFNSFIWIFRVH